MPESSREEIAKLEALYANNPEGRVFTHLAEALRKAGELERARTILEEGLNRHAGYASAHVVLGRVLMDEHKTEDAAEAFRRVLGLDPHNHVALRSLGDIARAGGRQEEALQYFDELRHLDPNNEEIDQIIAELTASAAPAPAEAAPVAEIPAEEPPAYQAPAPVAEMSEQGMIDLTEEAPAESAGDLDLGWMPEPVVEQLPGDLAGLAGMSVSDGFGELPSFEGIDPLAELTSFDLPMNTPEEDEGEPLPLENFAFDDEPATAAPLPAFEEEIVPVAAFEPEPEAEPEAEPAGEVLTETIAELYRTQGLYDRAADVYRALLKERPNDEGLAARLAEVEAQAAGPLPTYEPLPFAEPMAYEPKATEPAAEEPAVEEAEAWIAGSAAATEAAPTPYAWAETAAAAETNGGPPITAYFEQLLAWRPIAPAAAPEPAPAPQPAPAPEVSGMPDVEMEPDTMLLLDEAVETEAVGTEGFYDVQEPPAPEPEPPAPDPWMSVEQPAIEEPWESPAPAPSPMSAPAQAPAPTPPPAPEAMPGAESDNAGDAFDAWFGEPAPAAPAAAAPPAAPAPGQGQDEQPAGDDDDDLEMFRSWLQSLKK